MKEIEELEQELQFAIANGGPISAIKRDLKQAKEEEEEEEQLELELDFDTKVDELKVDVDDTKVDDTKVDVDDTKVDETE